MTSRLDLLACKSLQVMSVFFQALPLDSALAMGRALGKTVFYFSGRRHVAYADLKAGLGTALSETQRWKIVRQHYEHLGQMLVEVLRFPKLDRAAVEKQIKAVYPEGVFDVFKENQGGIFLTAHFGNWEMASGVPLKVFGTALHVLARSQKFPKLNDFLNTLRRKLGSEVTSRGVEVRNLLRSLRRREWVAVLGDLDAGKQSGLILSFLGRKTTVPTGTFELAAKTGVPVIPAFMVRNQGANHELSFFKPIQCRPGSQPDIEAGVRRYLSLLETMIRQYPSQWLWGTKRWKYTWTKRILILSDGKPGHVKQSQSLAEQMSSVETQYGRPGMEYPRKTIEVKYKSSFHRHLFPWIAFFFIPFAQGRLRFLKFFFEPQTAQSLEEASADFIVSTGSSLVPLNLCLAKDSRAKSVVSMKPSFPFHFFKFDLAVIPAHDQGKMPSETFRTLLTPSQMDPETLEADAEKLKKNLRNPSAVQYAVFLGGDTRRFKMKLPEIQKLFQELNTFPGAGDYLVTTSRRTSDAITNYLKKEIQPHEKCQMLVIAKEDNRPEVVGGMMFLAETLIVTEDSISMISEALRSGKRVLVLCFDGKGLPSKHRRFREILAKESAIVTASVGDFQEKLEQMKNAPPVSVMESEARALKERLQRIL